MKAIVKIGLWRAIAFLTVVSLFVSCCNDIPTVNTVSVSVNSSTITASGSVTSDGGADVFSYGICLSTNSLPTINDVKKECSNNSFSASSFKASFTNLEVNLTYYVRAYAINAEGIAYGEVISTKIATSPSIIGVAASSITKTDATFTMTVNPNRTTTENWFEYSSSGGSVQKIAAGNSEGNSNVDISIKVSGLTPGRSYSLVAKSKNEYGEASETITFSTYLVSDYDGNLYHGVVIGSQIWLQENFRGTHFANGDPIPNVTDATVWSNLTTGAYCWYNNDSKNGEVYGGLYNWYVGADPRGLIVGYHVPTVYEWGDLANYLASKYSEINSYVAAGLSAMEAGHTHWNTTSRIATNSSGFTALPSGSIGLSASTNKIIFMDLGNTAIFWASTAMGASGDGPFIDSSNCGFDVGTLFRKNYGFSLRLLKN